MPAFVSTASPGSQDFRLVQQLSHRLIAIATHCSLPTQPTARPPATMSVVGIDLGAQSTKIGVARNKGIDIVRCFPHSVIIQF